MLNKKLNTLLPGGFDAFVQVKQHRVSKVDPVELPDTPKTYEKKESGGVIGLMTDFKTDLKTDMVEAETEEKFAAKDYVRIMSDSDATRMRTQSSSMRRR